jgi:crotonobetainyl-CoA:carnitine CoA-transferase CaiB-like acyl-CoA transferase
VAYVCQRCGGAVELARTPLESGLVRLAALGAEGFELEFDDRAVHALAETALGPCPHVADPSWQPAQLVPIADAGWRALVAAEDDELETLAMVWRPRALALAGRAGELSRDDIVRGRLEQRVAQVSARMQEALDAGDEDEAERLHARAIELGTVLAGRLAAEWRS